MALRLYLLLFSALAKTKASGLRHLNRRFEQGFEQGFEWRFEHLFEDHFERPGLASIH